MKKIIIGIVLCIFVFMSIYIVFDKNIEIEDTYPGVYIDPMGTSSNENVKIKVVGYGRRSIFGHYEFDGKVYFRGEQFNLLYDSSHENILTAGDDGVVRAVGKVYLNNQFNEFVISFLQNGENYQVGEVVVFPSDSLQQAIEIFDEYEIDKVN